MRVGQNPAKFVDHVAKPERITVAVLSYVPFLSGFHAEALDVLRACLNSLWKHTDLEYDLMVFDNGSCREAVDFLSQARLEGRIQYLLLSKKNLGKGGAWNIIFEAAPGEIIAYSDSDAYFYSGWLTKSVDLLESFPRVGMVTSRPFRTPPEFYSATVDWANRDPQAKLERGSLIPWEAFREFDMSLGQQETEIREHYESTEDLRVTYRDKVAFIGGSHWQFVARKSIVRQFLPFDMERPMGQVRELDRKVNEAGYLRLMTSEPLAMNMSNTLIEVPKPGGQPARRRRVPLRRRLLEIPVIKRGLLSLYNAIFGWYYAG